MSIRYSNVLPIFVAFIVASTAVSAVYWSTFLAMLTTWAGSETYNHCFLVIPAFFYFVWVKREHFHGSYSPEKIFILPLLASGFLWLLGSLADVALVKQFAFMALIVSLTGGLLGWSLSRQILFPLFFLFLAVPVGDELLPVMMNFTADFTVGSLRLLGFPVFREGTHFAMPSGNWSVVEACSGVRYLIASVAIGLIYAYITYQKAYKRIIFMCFAIVVPILANGLRAVMIVLLGHYSNMTIATGVDHLVYGWIFFGVVMFGLFWVGSFWREEDQAVATERRYLSIKKVSGYTRLSTWGVLFATLLIWPIWENWSRSVQPHLQPTHSLEVSGSFTPCSECELPFLPSFDSANHYLKQVYTSDSSGPVNLFVASYYSWSNAGELISYKNQLVLPDDKKLRVVNTLSNSFNNDFQRIDIKGVRSLVAVGWYQINGVPELNVVQIKMKEALYRLLGRAFVSQYVVVFKETDNFTQGETELNQFLMVNMSALKQYGVVE